jgi:peptidoglycan hydrolase CwlO-like protein
MSEEYDSSNVYYSPFWPLAILLAGFIIWLGYQVFFLNEQRNTYNAQFSQAQPLLEQAQAAQLRLKNLMAALLKASQTNANAKAIIKQTIDAGIVRVTPSTNGAAAPAASTSTNDASTSTSSNS